MSKYYKIKENFKTQYGIWHTITNLEDIFLYKRTSEITYPDSSLYTSITTGKNHDIYDVVLEQIPEEDNKIIKLLYARE